MHRLVALGMTMMRESFQGGGMLTEIISKPDQRHNEDAPTHVQDPVTREAVTKDLWVSSLRSEHGVCKLEPKARSLGHACNFRSAEGSAI